MSVYLHITLPSAVYGRLLQSLFFLNVTPCSSPNFSLSLCIYFFTYFLTPSLPCWRQTPPFLSLNLKLISFHPVIDMLIRDEKNGEKKKDVEVTNFTFIFHRISFF